MTLTYKLSVQDKIVNKDTNKPANLSYGYKNVHFTKEQHIAWVSKGYAYCGSELRNGERKRENFTSGQLVSLDFDKDFNMSDVDNDVFTQKYGQFRYTTISHGQEGKGDRCRVTYLFHRVITDRNEFESLTKYLASKYPGKCDMGTFDCSRYWAGSTTAQVKEFEGQLLQEHHMAEALAYVESQRVAHEKSFDFSNIDLTAEAQKLRDEVLDYCTKRGAPGSGTYPIARNIIFALANTFDEKTAIALGEYYCPSNSANNWDVPRLVRDCLRSKAKDDREVTLATIYWDAKNNGYRPAPRVEQVKKIVKSEPKVKNTVEAMADELAKITAMLGYKVSKAKFRKLRHNSESSFIPYSISALKGGENYLEFNPEDAKAVYEAVGRSSYKYVVDISECGSGKTHVVPTLDPSAMILHPEDSEKNARLVYATQFARNPNNVALERDFVAMPARNNGYRVDTNKQTPGGKFHRFHPTLETPVDEISRADANCHRTEIFRVLQSKAQSTDGVCGTCPFVADCRKSADPDLGYGLHHLKHDVLRSKKIITSLQAIPGSPDEPVFNSNDTLVIDEWSQTFNPTQILEIEQVEIFKSLTQVFTIDPAMGIALQSVVTNLSSLMKTSQKVFGWDKSDLVSAMTGIDFSGLADKFVDFEAKRQEEITKSLTASTEPSHLESLEINWLGKFINIMAGREQGSVNGTSQKLTVTYTDSRVRSIIENFNTVFFQDATGSVERLALMLGVDVSSILVIRRKPIAKNNVKVVNISDIGLNNRRSKELNARNAVIRSVLTERHNGNIGFIDFKTYAQPGDLVHFVDGRGANAFETKEAVASFGVPYSNIGALKAEYETYSGRVVADNFKDELFDKFVSSSVVGEITQEIGRLRSIRRLDQELTYYIVGSVDTSFLQSLGYKVETVASTSIHHTAGNRSDRAMHEYIEAAKQVTGKLTQQALAMTREVTQGAVHNFAQKFGGWQAFKEHLVALVTGEVLVDNPTEAELEKACRGAQLAKHGLAQGVSASEIFQIMAEKQSQRTVNLIMSAFDPDTAIAFIRAFIEASPPELLRRLTFA